tara:strand:- start:11 stop:523 length:513 start_codon:yes stop_codon:yes gene_type:complete
MTEQELKWQGLLRGQITSATINKFMVVIRLLDQKAQIMIFLNSILVPVCLHNMDHAAFGAAALISIGTSILSTLAAIICIYPKRKYRKSGDRELNLLHYNDIGHMDKQEFLDSLLPKYNDVSQLAELAVNDLYDMARYSMIPKYMWLKISYGVFAVGNIIAIITAAMSLS